MMARPPSENPRDADTHIRQTSDEKAAWHAAAKSQGIELSDFIREAVEHYIEYLKKRKK